MADLSELVITDAARAEAAARIALHARVEVDMSLRPPTTAEAQILDELRARTKALAHWFVDYCPPGRELSLALTELDSATRWAIAAIIRQPRA